MENECNVAEYESFSDSIDGLYTGYYSDDGYISKNALGVIRDENCVQTDINVRDARLKMRDHINQAQSEWKGSKLSANNIGKVLYKLFKAILRELNNSLPTLG